jgi:hypothetical protein
MRGNPLMSLSSSTSVQRGRAIGAEQQQMCRPAPAREIRQHRDARRIAPVQIFEHHDQRPNRGERLERSHAALWWRTPVVGT